MEVHYLKLIYVFLFIKGGIFLRLFHNQKHTLNKKHLSLLKNVQGEEFITSYAKVKKSNKRPLKTKELAEINQNIVSMQKNGISLSDAFFIMNKKTGRSSLKILYKRINEYLQQGCSLSQAMLFTHKAFPKIMIEAIHAGERSNQLQKICETLAIQYEKWYHQQTKLRMAAYYPMILIFSIIAVIIIMLLFIVPTYTSFFEIKQLPTLTLFFMQTSKFISRYWYGIILMVCLSYFFCKMLLHHHKSKFYWDCLKIQLPIIKKILEVYYAAHFAQYFAILYASNVSVVKALQLIKPTYKNLYIKSEIEKVIERLMNGEKFTTSMVNIHGFDQHFLSRIVILEKQNSLEGAFFALAKDMNYELEVSINKIMTLFEPVIILVIACIVCMMMLAMLLPIIAFYNNPNAMLL